MPYLDFYLSHFIKFTLTVEDIIKNIQYNIGITTTNDFKSEFEKLLKSLSQEELISFNIAISGTSTLRSKYEINVTNTNNSWLPDFHTCNNQMNIPYNNKFKEHFFNETNGKNNFMMIINGVINEGYTRA